MPTVPTYKPGQVQNVDMPAVRFGSHASAESSFDYGTNSLLKSAQKLTAGAGDALFDKAEQQQDLTDKITARTAYNQFRQSLNDTYYNKVSNLKGLDATNANKVFETDAQQYMQDYSKNLSDKQRAYFQASADHAMLSFQDRIESYRSRQLEEANKNSLIGENKVITDEAVRDGRPQAMRNAEFTITQNLKAKNVGQDPAYTQSEINSAVHNLYAGRVEALLVQDPSRASMEIEQYKDKLNPVWYAKTKEKVDSAVVSQLDSETADKFYYEGLQKGKSRDEILKSIDDAYKKDKSRGNEISKLVNTKWAQQDAARKYDQQVREGQEWNNLFQNPNYKIPFDLDPATRKGMEDWRDKEVKRAAGQEIPTDRTVYHSLMSMSNDDFSKANLLDYSKFLSPSDFKDMVKHQQDVRSGKTEKADRFRTVNQQVDERVKGLSIFDQSKDLSDSKRQENSQRLSRFYEQFDQKLQQIPQDERTDKKVTEVINGLLKPVVEGHWYNSGTKYAFDLAYDSKLQPKAPSALQDKQGVQYDAEKDVWYMPKGDGLRGVYDSKGNWIKDQRQVKPASDSSITTPQASVQSKVPKSLSEVAPAFEKYGQQYGVDPALLAAIAMHETGNGTSSAYLNKNNAMGVSPNGGGPRSFDSKEESIRYMAERLASSSAYAKWRETGNIEDLARVYAPVGADNDPRSLNKYWASSVKKFYQQLKAS